MVSRSLIAPVALVVSLALNIVLIVLLIVCNIKAHNEATREAALENSHGGCGLDVMIACNPADGKFQVTCPSDGSDVTPIYQTVVDKANSCRATPS